MTRNSRFLMILGVLILAILACSGSDQSLSTPTTELEITGFVWLDENADGIRNKGENGVPKVDVRAVNDDPDNPMDSKDETDEDGMYALKINTTDEWTVIIEPIDVRTQFTYPNQGEDESIDSDVDPSGRAVYKKGQDIDAGLLPIDISQPPALPTPTAAQPPQPTQETEAEDGGETSQEVLVSGHVYIDHDINGLYDPNMDELGKNVQVDLLDLESGNVLESTTTDQFGRYSFIIDDSRNNSLLIQVVPNEDLAISPPSEGDANMFPSQVDEQGKSLHPIDPRTSSQIVDAGLHYPFEQEEAYAYDCATGEPKDENPFPEVNLDISIQDIDGIYWAVNLPGMLPGVPFCIGIDLKGEGKPAMKADPNNAMSEGTGFGASVCVVDGQVAGISAAQAETNGESVLTSSNATAEISAGLLNFFLPLGDIPGGMTAIRLAASDLNTCVISGDLTVNNGYRAAGEFGEQIAQSLTSAAGTRICDVANNACLKLPEELTWERTGDQTLNMTLNGVTFSIQFDVSEGTSDTREADFTGVGWYLEEGPEIQTPLRSWQVKELHANGQLFGLVAISDNGSSQKPFAFGISGIAAEPISDADLEALKEAIEKLSEGFSSAYELSTGQ